MEESKGPGTELRALVFCINPQCAQLLLQGGWLTA